MILSPTFVLGLAALLVAEEVFRPLPGPAHPLATALIVLALPIPAWIARLAMRQLCAAAILGGRHGRHVALLERAAGLSLPLLYGAMVGSGALQDLADRLAPTSLAGRAAVLGAPLLAMEVGLRGVQTLTLRWFTIRGLPGPAGMAPTWLRTAGLMTTALVAAGAAVDVIGWNRGLEALMSGTTIGTTLGLVAALAGLSVLLPAALVLVLPTDRRLPADLGDDIRTTVERLGFPFRSVRRLLSDGRLVTAALVGPLRWPRYLLLTDGILAVLDRVALRGVVAHEVGHARARHPMLLIVVFGLVPVLLLHPIEEFVTLELDDPVTLGALITAAVAAVIAVRALMHRFEFEADQLSAAALGGARPTILALERVGELSGPHADRATFRHPSGRRRVERLLAWDRDPAYRDRFARIGRAIRRALAAVVAAALIANVVAHARTWPGDRAAWLLLTGDFAAADRALSAAAPSADAESLRPLVDAAIELGGAGAPGAWNDLRNDLASRAFVRGLDALAARGADAAEPWLTLSLFDASPDAVRRSVVRGVAALDDDDFAEAERVALHLDRLRAVPSYGEAAARAATALRDAIAAVTPRGQ